MRPVLWPFAGRANAWRAADRPAPARRIGPARSRRVPRGHGAGADRRDRRQRRGRDHDLQRDGATTGLTLLWIFPITIVILAIVQEMAARLGVVTGQGLSDLIRDGSGCAGPRSRWWSCWSPTWPTRSPSSREPRPPLEIFGISRYLVVPIVAVAIWALVIKASYRTVERVFLSVIVVFGAYIVSAPPGRSRLGRVGRRSSRRRSTWRPTELLLMVAVVGHDDHAVHAVLPDQRRRREGDRRRRAPASSGPTRSAVDLDQRHRHLHRHRDRGDQRHGGRDRDRGGCGAGARAGGGPACRGAVRGRAVRGSGAGRHDHAAVDRSSSARRSAGSRASTSGSATRRRSSRSTRSRWS